MDHQPCRSFMKSLWKHTHILFVLLAALFLCVAEHQAQDSSNRHPMKPSSWSLQFQIRELSLSSFQGLAFSGKKHFTRRSAIRAGISISLSDDEDFRTDQASATDTAWNEQTLSTGNATLIVSGQYLYYAPSISDIHVFFGGGPLLTFYRSDRTENQMSARGDRRINNELSAEERMSGWGASIHIGVEWFATNDISFLGEYSLLIESRTSTVSTSVNSVVQNSREGSQLRIVQQPVRFGLSVYF